MMRALTSISPEDKLAVPKGCFDKTVSLNLSSSMYVEDGSG